MVWVGTWLAEPRLRRLEAGKLQLRGDPLPPKASTSSLLLQDLVAWVTTSFLHIPHAEDIPNTVTVGNRVGFLLQPYNFFDEDPSIYSPGSIYFERDQDAGLCSVNPVACTPHLAACVPNLPSFSYEGL